MLGRMTRPAALLCVPVLLGTLLLGGCVAGDPVAIGPTGVDELEIPTPSADPDDFVPGIDNPWLPLAAGNRWRYESTAGTTTEVVVPDETREVQGVATTPVETVVTGADGRISAERTEWYAQDADGNVWLFGAAADPDGSWEAGVDGAEAGLAMPAEPRVGDGYRQQLAPGVAEDLVTVLSVDEAVNVRAGSYPDLLQVEVTSPLDPDRQVRRYYARDTGLVYEETVSGGFERLELVEFAGG
jgi:hypothetical protein